MLLVFGFTVRFTTLAQLQFFCPRCGGDRTGARRAARRWFTLFWIPLIPMKRLGEIVECETCKTRFDSSVADQPTTADLAAVLDDAVRVLTAMIVRTGNITSPALRSAAVTEVARVMAGYDDSVLTGDIVALDPALAERYVTPLADGLEVAGKERLVSSLVRVALSDDTVTADQRRVIEHVGRGLGLTPAHVTGIVTSVVSEREPDPDPGHPA
ncbi:MAG: zinc-ribbon domain-containing protein [Acidimicrobiales bacterium]|nr:zinc-ribbon domain-containing protein [Acidimicrobiales bacterium]